MKDPFFYAMLAVLSLVVVVGAHGCQMGRERLTDALHELSRNSAELGYVAHEKGLTREEMFKLLEAAQ